MDFNSLLLAKLDQQLVNVGQMVGGHVVNKSAIELVIANAAVEPAQEQGELDYAAEDQGQPIGIGKFSHRLKTEYWLADADYAERRTNRTVLRKVHFVELSNDLGPAHVETNVVGEGEARRTS